MRWNYLARIVLLALAGAVAPTLMFADTIGMSSQNGTNYTYDFYSPAGTLNFSAGDTISLTGLTDVTGVTLSQYAGYVGSLVWDGTSVRYTLNQSVNYSSSSAIDWALFTVSSSDSNMGMLTYALQEDSGTQTGTIAPTGNVAATPEPGSLILMGTGAVVLFGLLRRQRARSAGVVAVS